jgi:thiamine-phosphate diphosphorylase
MLCLVTDRQRLGAALGRGRPDWAKVLEEQVAAAAGAGIDMVQVREPDLEAGELAALVRRLIASTTGTPAKIVVNDRLDVALAAGAAGVHLKERSYTPAMARRMVPAGFVIGCSIHGVEALVARHDADYLIAGTILPTPSKLSDRLLGWAGLSEIVTASAGKPVLGIGGLELPSVPMLAAQGASGLAAIGAFIPSAGEPLVEFVQKRVIDLRLAFDSARTVS